MAECRTVQIYSRQSLSAVGEKVPVPSTVTLRWSKITLATHARMRNHHRQPMTYCSRTDKTNMQSYTTFVCAVTATKLICLLCLCS